MSGRWSGVLWVMLSAVGFGAMPIFARIAYADGVSLTTLLFLRFAVAGTLLAAWGMARGMRWPRGGDLAWVATMGAVGYVGQSFGYFSALRHASAGLVALLLYLYPAIVTILSALLFRRRVGWGRGMAVAVALAGMALAVGGDLRSEPIGVGLGVAAALIYSIYILAGERVMPRVGALPAATVVMLAAAIVYGIAAASVGPALPRTPVGWAAVLAIAVLSTLLAIVGFFKGLARLGASDASTLSTLEPVVTIVLARWVLGEAVTAWQAVGGAAILAAVIYLARCPARD